MVRSSCKSSPTSTPSRTSSLSSWRSSEESFKNTLNHAAECRKISVLLHARAIVEILIKNRRSSRHIAYFMRNCSGNNSRTA